MGQSQRVSELDRTNRSFALRASQNFWPIRDEKGELGQQQPGITRMSCARMDVKPMNRRRRSVERVHAPRFKYTIPSKRPNARTNE